MKKGLILALPFCLACRAQAQTINSYISKGNDFYKQTQFSLAEAEYRKALQASPENTTAQYNLANALQKQKKYDEAIQVLEKLYGSANEKMLKSAGAYNQGVAYTKQKSLEASIEAYKKALRLNPEDKEARENLQKALSELKKQQNDQQQQQQKSKSNMSQREAEQKLNLLQEKEKELQQRLQNQNRQKGGKQSKDW
jgi:Ca-activated chloride channel family protein